MRSLVVHAPDQNPKTYDLGSVVVSIGRAATNDIIVDDVAASRRHAEIHVDEAQNKIFIADLDSTNGTFVNHVRIKGTQQLSADDAIRIGQVVINLYEPKDSDELTRGVSGTHLFTRELLLESLDQHAVLLYELARRLNFATSLKMVVDALTISVKNSLGVEFCEILMKESFGKLAGAIGTDTALRAIRNRAAEVQPYEMYVPIVDEDDIFGLMYLRKCSSDSSAFSRRHLQVAVAVSHQVSLSLQRISLLEKLRKEEHARQLFTRFVSPSEVKLFLNNYLETGELPSLKDENVTVMVADIAESTSLGEKMGVERFASVLNQFYNDAADIIFKHHGMLKYLGDGVMAIFVEMPNEESPEVRAVLSGKALLNRIKATGHLVLDQRTIIGVSVNTGVAMVGYIGTRERAEFNALGDVVNVAFRMQKYARPNRIVIGPETNAVVSRMYQTKGIGEVGIQGRASTVTAYEVIR